MANLSCVDYGQTAEDHQSLLVLVRHIGPQLKQSQFARVWERLKRLNCIHVQNQNRNIYVRYKRGYPKENNEWGDFQAHRKVLGLVSIGHCSNHKEFEDIFDNYKRIKEEYSNTIFNSRLVVFGMNTDGSPLSDVEGENVNDDDPSDTLIPSEGNESGKKTSKNNSKSDSVERNGDSRHGKNGLDDSSKSGERKPHSNSLTKESTGSEVVFYPDLDHSADLEERLKEFVTSLFYVLEGKRLDRSFERADRLHLPCAPFEKKDYVGVDQETKSFRKKCMGRLRKHLADLCLQAGMPGEAILHYQTAMDILRGVNDFLWIGACYEGLSSASTIMTYPQSDSSSLPLRRNQSFSTKRGVSMLNDGIAKSAAYANGLDLAEVSAQGGLHPDDIIEKYKDAIMNYSKFKNASMIEMEASFKACRVLILQKKYLQASDFLQNVVYINLVSTDEDKIHRFSTLASLYTQIGFHRKAAFFKRVAGMQCVAPGTSAGWMQCYYLLVHSLPGYNISLDPREFLTDHPSGWPVIQYRVLHELVYSSRRMGNPQLAVRHMTFLLHSMYDKLTASELKEAMTGLDTLTAKCEGTPHPLPLDNGQILPSVPLNFFPVVKSFKVIPPVPHLHPQKLSASNCDKPSKSGVFIYTPLSLDSDKEINPSKCDFLWVEGDMCEVHLQVYNPLPEELTVTYMGLLTEGVEMEIFPANPSVPAETGPVFVKLYAKPKAVGQLSILGYSTLVFGVRSNCRLKDLAQIPQPHFDVEVVPGLPQLSLTSSLPKAASFTSVGDGANIVASSTALLYAGQSLECQVTLHNGSSLPVEHITVSLDTKLDDFIEERMFSWSTDNIQSQLPLQSANQLCFSVYIYGYGDFLTSELQSPEMPSPVYSNRSRSDSSEGKAVEAVLSVQYSGKPGLDAGYCRQCSLALIIDILPSLVIANWDVQPAHSPDQCVLVFDIQNVTSHQMDLEYDGGKTIIIEPQQSRSITCQIARVNFPAKVEQINATPCVPSVYRQCRPVNHYSHYLSDFVDVKWSIPATKVYGKLGIEHLMWTESQLELLQKSPVRWEVRFDDQLYLYPDVPTFCVEEIVNIQVSLHCDTGYEEAVTILIEPMQVCNNVQSIVEESILGVHTKSVLQLPKPTSVHHSCAFVFHTTGLYRLNVQCSKTDISLTADTCPTSAAGRQSSSDTGSGMSAEKKCATSFENTDVGDDRVSSDNECRSVGRGSECASLARVLWQCLPVPEFMVVDS